MKIQKLPLVQLKLDPENFRHPEQSNEIDVINMLIKSHIEKYTGLINSIVENGFEPIENIIVYNNPEGEMIVAEGNRRVSVLKLIHRKISTKHIQLTDHYIKKLKSVPVSVRKETIYVPCAVYAPDEKEKVDKLVARMHGKADFSSRQDWNQICRARHNRKKNMRNEYGLCILEKFLSDSQLHTPEEAMDWQLNYPVPQLDEVVSKCATIFKCTNQVIVDQYERLPCKTSFEQIIVSIGRGEISYNEMRATDFFSDNGIVNRTNAPLDTASESCSSAITQSPEDVQHENASEAASSAPLTVKLPQRKGSSVRSPKNELKQTLKAFNPQGTGRDKLISLLKEMWELNVDKSPIVFCIALRSMFDISATLYAKDNRIPIRIEKTNREGKIISDKKQLKGLLQEIKDHIVLNDNHWSEDANKERLNLALRYLTSTDQSLLTITDLHDVVHNPSFTVSPSHVYDACAKMLPLLKAMNGDV